MVNLNQYIYKVKLVCKGSCMCKVNVQGMCKGKFTRVKLSVTGIDVIYCKIIMAYINYSTSDLFVCYYLPCYS